MYMKVNNKIKVEIPTSVGIKICGMKHNVAQVAALQPDYLGFIFYEKSARNYEEEEIATYGGIKSVGVFVNASISFIMKKIKTCKLDVIQLHGDESDAYINQINQSIFNLPEQHKPKSGIEIWKVFSVGEDFDFGMLSKYENIVDKFLFDTKGKDKGGNGLAFNWSILKGYPSTKPFLLSGGISMENISEVKELLKTALPIYAIDVNSKFEDSPGMKNIEELKKLITELE